MGCNLTEDCIPFFDFGSVRALYMPDELNLWIWTGEKKLVEEVDEFFLHVLVNVAVAGEGFATFFVTAE